MTDRKWGAVPIQRAEWGLRRMLVLGVTRYLMYGLPAVILIDVLFGRNFTAILGVPALTGIVGLPGSYLVGRSLQTAIRESKGAKS